MPKRVFHMRGVGSKTACGIKITPTTSMIVLPMSREGYKQTTCKRCKKVT